MNKSLLITIMACGLALAGCGNNDTNDNGSAEPDQTGQETAVPATAPATATPIATVPATAAPDTSATTEPPAASGTRQQYLAKLAAVEEGLGDLQSLKDQGTTLSMTVAANKEYERWDQALNEIYAGLKQQLSESDMAELKEKQLDWISYRDETAEKEAAKYEGGTAQPMEYTLMLANVTKDRCYELVNMYMK